MDWLIGSSESEIGVANHGPCSKATSLSDADFSFSGHPGRMLGFMQLLNWDIVKGLFLMIGKFGAVLGASMVAIALPRRPRSLPRRLRVTP